MKKINFSIFTLTLVSQNLAFAGLSFDKRCTKDVPYISTWVEKKSSYNVGQDVDGSAFELPNGDILIGAEDYQIHLFDKDLKKKDSYYVGAGLTNGFEMSDNNTAVTFSNNGTPIYYKMNSGFFTGESIGHNLYYQMPSRLSDGTVVVGTLYGVALNRRGKSVTVNHAGGTACLAPAVMVDDMFVTGCSDGNVYYFNPAGEAVNKYSTGAARSFKAPMILPNGNVGIGSEDGYFYLLSPDGKLIAKSQNYSQFTSSPNMADENTIVAATNGGYVLFLDARTLAEKTRFPKQGSIGIVYYAITVVTTSAGQKLIVVGSSDRYVYFLTTRGELVTKFLLDGWAYSTPLATSNGNIVIGDRAEKVYLLEIKSEKRTRKAVSGDCVPATSNAEEAEAVQEPTPSQVDETGNDSKKNDRFD